MELMMNLFSNNLVSKTVSNKFINYFAKGDIWHQQDLKTGNLGYGWIHYGLIRSTRPKNVLCIGSRYGFVPAVCALACKDNKSGLVDFVDAGYDIDDYSGPDEHWGGVGFWKRCYPTKYFGKFGLANYIKLWVMRSDEYEGNNKTKKYGYVHIDGDHSYAGVKADFDMFWPKVAKGGFLAIHDIGSPDKDGNVYGTRRFWKELTKKYPVALQFVEDPGVGILQKT
jgi:hypothetical protein